MGQEQEILSGLMPKDEYSFYPTQKYISNGWAPEKISLTDLRALAWAQQGAQQAGVLSPELGAKMLPNALVERRPGNFGVNTYTFYDVDPLANGAAAMGLTPTRLMWDPKTNKTQIGEYVPAPSHKQNMTNSQYNANMAAVILGLGNKSPDDAVRAWNGKGIVRDRLGRVLASADNHLRKVQEMERMLALPQNEEVRQIYNAMLNNFQKVYQE